MDDIKKDGSLAGEVLAAADLVWFARTYFSRADERSYDELTGRTGEACPGNVAASQGIALGAQGIVPPAWDAYRVFCCRTLTSGFATSALPVESLYKPWGLGSKVAFGASGGCFDGAPAEHMRYLYDAAGITVPEVFSAMPDHLALLLEYRGMLCEAGAWEQVATFDRDHLDWLDDYRAKLERIATAYDPAGMPALEFAIWLVGELPAALDATYPAR